MSSRKIDFITLPPEQLSLDNHIACAGLGIAYRAIHANTTPANIATKTMSPTEYMYYARIIGPDDAVHNHMIIAATKHDLVGVGTVRETDGLIDNIAIEPKFRGQQIGRKIMCALEKQALLLGLSEVFLRPLDEVVGFYKQLGYQLSENTHGITTAHKTLS